MPKGQKNSLAEGQSPAQELEVVPRSGPYLLVVVTHKVTRLAAFAPDCTIAPVVVLLWFILTAYVPPTTPGQCWPLFFPACVKKNGPLSGNRMQVLIHLKYIICAINICKFHLEARGVAKLITPSV